MVAREGAAREIIRDALARALFDAAPEILDDLGGTALDGRPRRCDGAQELARRVVAELDHAGWVLKSARDCTPETSPVRRRLSLEDHVCFGITSAPFATRAALGSNDRDLAHKARGDVAAAIHDAFRLMRVVLGRRAKGR
jgi:hypothetical protein